MHDILDRPVDLPGSSPFLLTDVGPDAPEVILKARLLMPAEARAGDRLPGMMISHGLGGAKQAREYSYARWFAEQGYAALVVDSYVGRGMGDISDGWRALNITESMFLADAFAGLAYLQDLPQVDPARVGIMGFSYGGMVAQLSAYDQIRRLFQGETSDRPPFGAHVSYYGCSVPRLDDVTTTGAPVLLVMGEKDKNVSIERSREIAEDFRKGGSDVGFHVIKGAYHQWDGADDQKRRKIPSLGNLEVRVDRQNRIFGSRSRITFKGWWSRAAAIGAGIDISGYHILKDLHARALTDDLTRGFLREAFDITDERPARPSYSPAAVEADRKKFFPRPKPAPKTVPGE
jgi:dienelactone hydrolase